jgi:hypothetical protein
VNPRPGALLVLLALVPTAGLGYELHLEDAYPVRDRGVHVTVTRDGAPAAGVVVEVHYRPNSQTTSVETLPLTDEAGTTEWRPSDAGIVTLVARWPDSEEILTTRNVAVRFGGFPGEGILVLLVAGVLLFGGAVLGFVRLLRPPPHVPVEEPPST